jgi:hypothetical protein
MARSLDLSQGRLSHAILFSITGKLYACCHLALDWQLNRLEQGGNRDKTGKDGIVFEQPLFGGAIVVPCRPTSAL